MERIAYHALDGFTLERTRRDNFDAWGAIIGVANISSSDPADRVLLNNEANDMWQYLAKPYGVWEAVAYRVMFPEPYTISGVFASFFDNEPFTADHYIATRNATTGTWTSRRNNFSWSNTLTADWNDSIYSFGPIANVDAVAVTALTTDALGCQGIHLYGSPDDKTQKLRLWHPTLDQEYADQINFGTMNPEDVVTQQFRIKNTATVTAPAVVVSASDLTGDMADGIDLSTDDSTYTPTLNLGSLAPGAVTPVLYVRRTVATGAAFTEQAGILTAVGGW